MSLRGEPDGVLERDPAGSSDLTLSARMLRGTPHERGITREKLVGQPRAFRRVERDPDNALCAHIPTTGITGFSREALTQLGESVPLFRQQMVLAIRRCVGVLTNDRAKTPAIVG